MEIQNCREKYLVFLSRLLDALIMNFHNGCQIMLIDTPHPLMWMGQKFMLKIAAACSEREQCVCALRAGCFLPVWISLTRGPHKHTNGLLLMSRQR